MSRIECQRDELFAALPIGGAAFLGRIVSLEEGWCKVDGLAMWFGYASVVIFIAMTRCRCGLNYFGSDSNLTFASVAVLVASSAGRPMYQFPPPLDS
jgi:hypothetical protein